MSNRTRKIAIAVVLVFAGVTVIWAFGDATRWERDQSQWLIHSLIRVSATIEMKIDYYPRQINVTAANFTITQVNGDARITLHNPTEHVVRVAFPPLRTFTFGETEMSLGSAPPEYLPVEWSGESVIELEPGESRQYQAARAYTTLNPVVRDNRYHPGYLGVVFGVPPGAEPEDYCTGTVFAETRTHWPASQ
jgi:hypothetical protein